MRFLGALLILTLSGCGMAVSDKPMFTATDTAGAPQFEDGVWLMPHLDEKEDCKVDTKQPVSTWPACADWALHRDGQWFAREGDSGIATKPVPREAVVVSNGDIAIIQLESEPTPGAEPDPMPYMFIAFDNKPAATTKLRSIRFWIVMCGRYEPNDAAKGDEEEAETLVRFPGFDEKCRPESVAVLRAAADASRPPAHAKAPPFRWARAALD